MNCGDATDFADFHKSFFCDLKLNQNLIEWRITSDKFIEFRVGFRNKFMDLHHFIIISFALSEFALNGYQIDVLIAKEVDFSVNQTVLVNTFNELMNDTELHELHEVNLFEFRFVTQCDFNDRFVLLQLQIEHH